MKILQDLGNYADMNQGVVGYMVFAIDVFLICWFGTQLTQHVRENDILYILKNFKYIMLKTTILSGNDKAC
jgi:hypothetical protein